MGPDEGVSLLEPAPHTHVPAPAPSPRPASLTPTKLGSSLCRSSFISPLLSLNLSPSWPEYLWKVVTITASACSRGLDILDLGTKGGGGDGAVRDARTDPSRPPHRPSVSEPAAAASAPQARLPGRGHSPGHPEGTFPTFAVTAGRVLCVSCDHAPGAPLRAGLLPLRVRRKESDSDQPRLAPSQASGLYANTGTMGISLEARRALAVTMATAQGHGALESPFLLTGLRRPEGVTVLTGGSLLPFLPQTGGLEGNNHVSPGGPRAGALSLHRPRRGS